MPKDHQPIDTARLSLEEFRSVARIEPPTETAAQSRRDIADVFAAVYWSRWVRRASGCPTPYAVGRAVEPDAYWSADGGERFHRNKWSKYERGLHCPRDTLVDKTERTFPGSARQFRHVLWTILKQPPRSEHLIAEFEAMLAPDVHSMILKWRPRVLRSANNSLGRLPKKLEQVADLDALAAMILQIHAARLAGNTMAAHRWAYHLYRCLLLISDDLRQCGIAQPLFELIQFRLLKNVSHDGRQYYFPAPLYIAASHYLSDILKQISGTANPALDRAQRVSFMQLTLDLYHGLACRSALNPILQVTSNEGPPSESYQRVASLSKQLFIWGWNMRREERPRECLPTSSVFDGTDLHAWQPSPWRDSCSR
ncbi:MAG TPA: hypothetical protein PKE37_16895 [Thiomonas arsenitoxydans]|jgi:hypothetical protein|uniref:hypothetical protein n=1 Tax=Thiomonas arsenitoxydans (strain DSM 22701 / CIP 110005 / 3As) TaxID=426114 RepID=UPI002B705E09|nr:hypothetical protein [Thiomonas arsenitoxydans]HML83430.1 hypothetical protein [Thiomonas arsenitoxydans]